MFGLRKTWLSVPLLALLQAPLLGCGSDGGSDAANLGAECAREDDCEKGERCNGGLEPPRCQKIHTVGKGETCGLPDGPASHCPEADELCAAGLACAMCNGVRAGICVVDGPW